MGRKRGYPVSDVIHMASFQSVEFAHLEARRTQTRALENREME